MVSDPAHLLAEADTYFMGQSKLHKAARQLASILDDAGIPYAVAGAIALAVHGRRRLTEDVDILITRDGLAAFKKAWLGRGYVEISPGLKAVRDTTHDVKIDFLLTGDFPGDGEPKPVRFPRPPDAATTLEGLRVVSIETLVELKLASGMTAAHRGQDLVDVMELIRARRLDRDWASRLDESVREKFAELWELAQVQDDY